MSYRSLQLTLALIKPHVLKAPHVLQNIRNLILSNGFYIVDTKERALSESECRLFYQEHQNKFFYNRLVTSMSSGAIHAHILARENAISKWRELLGPTKVFKTQFSHPHTIRGQYGLSDTRNAAHGSDSPESAAQEISFFFPNFNVSEWYAKSAEKFYNGEVEFDEKKFIHMIKVTEPVSRREN